MIGNRRVFYDVATGDKIHEIGRTGDFTLPTIEQDIETFTALSERNRETFDVIELPFGTYAQDFAECNGYRVNPTTKALEFSYPDASQPDAPPVYQRPLTAQIAELNLYTQKLNDDMTALAEFVTNGGM